MKKILMIFPLLIFAWQIKGQVNEVQSKTFNFYIKSRDQSPPTIFWIKPELEVSLSKEQYYNLKVGIKCPSGIDEVILKINGVISGENRGMGVVNVNTGSGEYDYFIDNELSLIEGDNIIEIAARNKFGTETLAKRTIRFTSDIVSRKDLALIFATDRYDNWENLTNPIYDAKTIAEVLINTYGYEVELLEDNTIPDILLKLKEYAAKSYAENDQLFIFFAGHGHYDDLLGDGYIVGKDSKRIDPANTSYLSFSVLERALNNLPSRHVFLTMDVCFGGTFDARFARSVRGEKDIYAEVLRDEFISRMLKYRTRKFLTSGGKDYVPDGRPGMHSPFAKKFIEALRTNGGKDRILTLSEVLNEVSTINPAPHFGDFGNNEAGSDFIFIAR